MNDAMQLERAHGIDGLKKLTIAKLSKRLVAGEIQPYQFGAAVAHIHQRELQKQIPSGNDN